ncbi:hypothetical protein [Halomonas alkalisoli]|uniref:hypothetical protein n=1 Tax=Halomonas alkalisoli TaxID=2907158 RepID=UPI001F159F0E|nr:hypothetical protein [Halomonas alkalisoli]MCE9683027.1 hypothetical protein [Halomonas alkalisoli]
MTTDDIETTWLGQWAAQSAAPHDGQSGFAQISSGQGAFSLRVLFARLLDAAKRGVKVRLLFSTTSVRWPWPAGATWATSTTAPASRATSPTWT